jgi:hypothetical protein
LSQKYILHSNAIRILPHIDKEEIVRDILAGILRWRTTAVKWCSIGIARQIIQHTFFI